MGVEFGMPLNPQRKAAGPGDTDRLHRVVEHPTVLGNERDQTEPGVVIDLTDVEPIDEVPALLGVSESEQQLDQGEKSEIDWPEVKGLYP